MGVGRGWVELVGGGDCGKEELIEVKVFCFFVLMDCYVWINGGIFVLEKVGFICWVWEGGCVEGEGLRLGCVEEFWWNWKVGWCFLIFVWSYVGWGGGDGKLDEFFLG